jgi:hypothetical protein
MLIGLLENLKKFAYNEKIFFTKRFKFFCRKNGFSWIIIYLCLILVLISLIPFNRAHRDASIYLIWAEIQSIKPSKSILVDKISFPSIWPLMQFEQLSMYSIEWYKIYRI